MTMRPVGTLRAIEAIPRKGYLYGHGFWLDGFSISAGCSQKPSCVEWPPGWPMLLLHLTTVDS